MTENSVVRARIDETTKSEAAAVLAAMGLSLSDAFRLLLKRVAAEKALPFEPLVPNAETVAAMKAARQGDVTMVDSPASLLASLMRAVVIRTASSVIIGARNQKGAARSWTVSRWPL